MSNRLAIINQEKNGGRVFILFLLFFLALYQFYSAGFSVFAIVCLLPLLIPIIYVAFTWQMLVFWALIFINYFIHFFGRLQLLPNGIPMSLYNEALEILLIAIAIVDARKSPHFDRTLNVMLVALLCWSCFCTLEVLNDTCNLGIDIAGWYGGARMMAFQLVYAFLIFTLYITTPEYLIKYLRLLAALSLFSAFWTWKQVYIGFSPEEARWLNTVGYVTHVINGGTLTRYWSTHNDAANYGIGAAATAVIYITTAITAKLRSDRIFFAITAILIIWGMFQSGTRTAIVCLIFGFAVVLILLKSIKIIVPSAIIGGVLFSLLVFTNIGQGNQQIRRMRSAFDKSDASANVRTINQETIRKYIADAPWGLGLSVNHNNVPANNKYKKLSVIAPDSEYVFIWMHTGPIGITIFLILTAIMFLGACYVVFVKLKNRSLVGIGAGFCGAFAAIQLGGYGNQILMQFPNCLIFYGGLTIVYILPYIENEWVEYENKRVVAEGKKRQLKLEKKKALRV